MMKQIKFTVHGSSEPYEVTFITDGTEIAAHCTCKAGEHGRHCKHRINLLAGDTSGIISTNARGYGERHGMAERDKT